LCSNSNEFCNLKLCLPFATLHKSRKKCIQYKSCFEVLDDPFWELKASSVTWTFFLLDKSCFEVLDDPFWELKASSVTWTFFLLEA